MELRFHIFHIDYIFPRASDSGSVPVPLAMDFCQRWLFLGICQMLDLEAVYLLSAVFLYRAYITEKGLTLVSQSAAEAKTHPKHTHGDLTASCFILVPLQSWILTRCSLQI